MILSSKKTNQLNKKEVSNILNLKEQQWKFGLNSQKKFFKKNVKNYDFHNFIYSSQNKKNLIGYTCFRIRHLSVENQKFKYMLLDSIIIKKKFQKKNYGRKLMKFNNSFIKKKKLPSFLFCSKKNLKFFEMFKWKKIISKNFRIPKKNKKFCMCYNSNQIIIM